MTFIEEKEREWKLENEGEKKVILGVDISVSLVRLRSKYRL